MLHELAVAFCLMLVIEGVLPFIAPKRWRNLILMLDEVDAVSYTHLTLPTIYSV